MPSSIEFFFDFGSGYSYFAATEIDEIAARHGRETRWRAFSLGTAFKRTSALPLTRAPLKSDYTRFDWSRIARSKGLAFEIPEGHPHAGLPALRAFHVIDRQDRALAKRFALEIFRRYFDGSLAIDDLAEVSAVAASLGFPVEALASAVSEPELKAYVREVGEQAVAGGVFGAPWTVVDGEPFWGWDRLPMIDRTLSDRSTEAAIATVP